MDDVAVTEVTREIKSLATEDMYGLYEIIWRLNVSHAAYSPDTRVSLARAAVCALARDGFIAIHRLKWQPPRDLGPVPLAALEALLSDPSSWEPGAEYIGFVATAVGCDAYLRGLIGA